MKLIIKIFGILFVLIGISFLTNPEGVYNWVEENTGNILFFITVIVGKLLLGILLVLAAKDSKYPSLIKFLGYFVIIVALIGFIIGYQGFQEIISLMIPLFKPYAFVSGLIGISIGVFFIYAFSMNKKLEQKLN